MNFILTYPFLVSALKMRGTCARASRRFSISSRRATHWLTEWELLSQIPSLAHACLYLSDAHCTNTALKEIGFDHWDFWSWLRIYFAIVRTLIFILYTTSLYVKPINFDMQYKSVNFPSILIFKPLMYLNWDWKNQFYYSITFKIFAISISIMYSWTLLSIWIELMFRIDCIPDFIRFCFFPSSFFLIVTYFY